MLHLDDATSIVGRRKAGNGTALLQGWGNALSDYARAFYEVPKALYNLARYGDANHDYRGSFKGGQFNGAGAGGSWGNYVPTAPRDTIFNDAYDAAVAKNLLYFMFGGKRYNTKKENNPLRELNNRVVGTGRTNIRVQGTKGYPTEYGPYIGPGVNIPIVTNTYTKKKR